jgi:threonine synthase
MIETLSCIDCPTSYPITEVRYTCDCGGQLEVTHPAAHFQTKPLFDVRAMSKKDVDVSGVWRFREALLTIDESAVVTHPEGATRLYERDVLTRFAGLAGGVAFKHEGENPTGSFKDRGMTVAVTQAKRVGATWLACASTGNTSASLAAYAAQAGLPALVFVPAGKIALGKLAQTLAYGATCVAVKGDFDAAMRLVQESSQKLGAYLVNSLNPFRLEGQKTIIWETLLQRGWRAPDWIVVPAGNLGNTSAFGKALREARAAGWIDKLPRLVAVQAQGANPFFRSWQGGFKTRTAVQADTVATAIRIGDPVNFPRAVRAIRATDGLVLEVPDDEIMAAKRCIDAAGIGCEPASAASLAGLKRLVSQGIVKSGEEVVCILTGHVLKDPDAVLTPSFGGSFTVHEIEPELGALEALLGKVFAKAPARPTAVTTSVKA